MAKKPSAGISRSDIEEIIPPACALITDVQHLASYNWIEAPTATPTIAVPGSPDLWSPPKVPFRLKKDTGRIYIAQNAARRPESPLEPLFRALYVAHPSFNIGAIDVVTDRNNVRKLLGVINPRWNGYKREDFTIHVEVRNNTAILCRNETKVDEYIGPHEFRGYGHSFEEKCTNRRVNGSTGHHRIISYSFGGLKFIVRHETDGYVGVASAQPKPQPAGSRAPDIDHLSGVLDSLSLSPESSSSRKANSATTGLVIRREGQIVPLPLTLEIKTRVSHRPLEFEDVVAQLWISQTPKLVRAYHTKGMFAVPKVEDVADQVKAWEDQNQKDLRLLAGLIQKIRDIVKKVDGRAILKYDANGDNLTFHELSGKRMLPANIYAKWDGSNEQITSVEVKNVLQSVNDAESEVIEKTRIAAGIKRA
jgi:hypothetical protein